MNSRTPAKVALCTTLAFAAVAVQASDAVHTPRTAVAKDAAVLISRAERALTGYVAACASRDAQRLIGLTTDDVRIEFALNEPGTYLTVDAGSLIASCAPGAWTAQSHAADGGVWIFPTHDANTVFVQYEASAGSRQLALVEMRGDRISRMVNFSAAPAAMLSSVSPVAAAESPCVSRVME